MTKHTRDDDAPSVMDVMDLLRAANPVPQHAITDARLDLRARRDLDRILIGDIAPLDLDQLQDQDQREGQDHLEDANHGHAPGKDADGGSSTSTAASATAAPATAASATEASATGAPSNPNVSLLWRRRPLTKALAAATAVAAATVIGVMALGQAGPVPVARADTPPALVITAPPATMDGAQTLRDLAGLAIRQPAIVATPYLFTEAINYTVNTSFGDDGTTVEVVPNRSQVWLAPGGQVHRESVSAGGTDAWNSNGVLDPALISSAGAFKADYVAADRDRSDTLSTDPAALLAQLNADGPGTDGGIAAGYLSDLFNRFQNGLPTPAQQAAIWQVLAGTGQFKTLGDTTDRAGRPAVALSYDTTGASAGQLRYQLLISPTTGLLLGYEQITLKQSAQWQQQVPAVTGGTTFLWSATADQSSVVPTK